MQISAVEWYDNELMKDTAQGNDIGRFDFDYIILVVNARNGKDLALTISIITLVENHRSR
jgi:hypothetical protein